MKTVAIEQILAHDRFVRLLACHLLGDGAMADDATQEVWLKAMTSGPRPGGSLRGWLAKVLRNIGTNLRRGQVHRVERERRASRTEACEPASAIVEREEVRRRLVAAILGLGHPRSTIILLRYFEGVPPRGIAARLGMPVETVRTHLKRSLPLLRERLESQSHPGGSNLLQALPVLLIGPRPPGLSIGLIMSAKTKVALAGACALLVMSAWLVTRYASSEVGEGRGVRRETPGTATGAQTDNPKSMSSPGTISPQPFTEESSESSATASIRGSVVDSAGKGIAGASVYACDAGVATTIPPASPGGPSTPFAITDDGGRFAVRLELPRRLLSLGVTAPGFSSAIVSSITFEARPTIVLERPIRITGRTLDTAGNVLKGVLIRWSSGDRGVSFAREVVSNDEGGYELADLPSGALARSMLPEMVLEASAPGFAPVTVFVAGAGNLLGRPSAQPSCLPGTVIEQDLVLPRGARVRGRLYDAETKTPIAGGVVTFRSLVSSDAIRSPTAPGEQRRTSSDAEGAYAFDQVPSLGFHQLASRVAGHPVGTITAKPEGFGECRVIVPESPEGSVLDIDLACWRSARASGRVVDSKGAPQAGVEVWAYVRSLGDSQVRPATTGADGRFALEAIPAKASEPTPVELYANPAGSRSLPPGTTKAASRQLALRAGDDVTIDDLVLDPLPGVLLRIVDPSGLPIQGALARMGWHGIGGPTAADGRCRLPSTPDAIGKRGFVRIWASGFGPAFRDDLVPSLSPAETTVVLSPGRRLKGRVLWTDRAPARGIDIAVTEERAGSEIAAHGVPSNASEADRFRFQRSLSESDDEGRFDFQDLTPGPCWVAARVRPKGSARDEKSDPQVLLADVRDDDVTIVLPPDAASIAAQSGEAVVDGTITSAATRRIVSTFTATLSRPGGYLFPQVPTLGRFRFEGVPSGKWHLRVEAPGFTTLDREVEVGSTPLRLDLALEEGLSISGTVHVSAGLRLAEIRIYFTDATQDHSVFASIAADGTYRASGLAPGRYLIGVTYPNAGRWDKALAATPPFECALEKGSPPLRRDIEVVRGGWINVGISQAAIKRVGRTALLSVVDASGRAAYELEVRSVHAEGGMGAMIAVPEGAYRVRLSAGETIIVERDATAADGAEAMVRIE